MKEITSVQNPLIKKILQLQEKSKLRTEENLFIIDGWKETQMAIANNFEIETILFRKGFGLNFDELDSGKTVEISEAIFEKIAYRGNTSKVVAIAKQKPHHLDFISFANPTDKHLILVIDGVEKPGNLGAILRVADAANLSAVICCDTKTDVYNPNVIRSSVGCVFTQQIAIASKEETLQFLKNRNVSVFTTSLKSSKDYLECDYKNSTAFVLGAESIGVDAFWENHSTQNIIIPMRGQNDSLNVSNTAAIILFEALRQRN